VAKTEGRSSKTQNEASPAMWAGLAQGGGLRRYSEDTQHVKDTPADGFHETVGHCDRQYGPAMPIDGAVRRRKAA